MLNGMKDKEKDSQYWRTCIQKIIVPLSCFACLLLPLTIYLFVQFVGGSYWWIGLIPLIGMLIVGIAIVILLKIFVKKYRQAFKREEQERENNKTSKQKDTKELIDYFVIKQNGEIMLNVSEHDLTEDFLSQAKDILAEQFLYAERKCQTKKYKNVKDNVIAGIGMMAFMACTIIVGMFLSIFWDLAFIVLMVFAAICFIGFGVMFYRNKNKLRQLQSQINRCELLIGKIINLDIRVASLSVDLQYRYCFDGKEEMQTVKIFNGAMGYYRFLPYVIVAYDTVSAQSYPVRLFLKTENDNQI